MSLSVLYVFVWVVVCLENRSLICLIEVARLGNEGLRRWMAGLTQSYTYIVLKVT